MVQPVIPPISTCPALLKRLFRLFRLFSLSQGTRAPWNTEGSFNLSGSALPVGHRFEATRLRQPRDM